MKLMRTFLADDAEGVCSGVGEGVADSSGVGEGDGNSSGVGETMGDSSGVGAGVVVGDSCAIAAQTEANKMRSEILSFFFMSGGVSH